MHGEFATRRVGQWLREKYRLDAVIGVGGMAAVYRGVHRNGNRVAVKVLHTELSVNAEMRARFLKEGYLANAVEHPGAVRVLDDDATDDGTVFIVMELLEGETLDSRWVRRRRLPAPEVAELAFQTLDVLAAAHAKGIVHRDIKPENLFLTQDGQVKVLDFGIARMRDDARAVTRTGRMLGTPAYMPKEQALGLTKQIDGRTDLWAVGATMFALISGRFVHEGETAESMIVFTATRPARSLASVMPDVPAALTSVIDRALAFERDDRFADALAMQAALQTAHRAAFGSLIGTPSARALLARAAPTAPSLPVPAPAAPPPTVVSAVGATHDQVDIEPLLLGLGGGDGRTAKKAEKPRALEPRNPVTSAAAAPQPVMIVPAPHLVTPPIAPSPLKSGRRIPVGVSTTGGVSSVQRPYLLAQAGSGPAISSRGRSRTLMVVLAIGSVLAGVIAVAVVAMILRAKAATDPTPEPRGASSEQPTATTSAATATATEPADPAQAVGTEASPSLTAGGLASAATAGSALGLLPDGASTSTVTTPRGSGAASGRKGTGKAPAPSANVPSTRSGPGGGGPHAPPSAATSVKVPGILDTSE